MMSPFRRSEGFCPEVTKERIMVFLRYLCGHMDIMIAVLFASSKSVRRLLAQTLDRVLKRR